MHRITAFLALAATVLAQTPADPDANAPAASPAQNRQPKQLPPPGVAIPDADRAELTTAVAELGKEIAALNLSKLGGGMNALIPDVEVFHKAVDWALRYDEFYNVKEVATARTLLAEGKSRAAALKEGEAPWTTQTGLVVRGYRSKIDGSVQPFGRRRSRDVEGPGRQSATRDLDLESWARGDSLGAFVHSGPDKKRGGIHAGRHVRRASVRTLLQRDEVCGRG